MKLNLTGDVSSGPTRPLVRPLAAFVPDVDLPSSNCADITLEVAAGRGRTKGTLVGTTTAAVEAHDRGGRLKPGIVVTMTLAVRSALMSGTYFSILPQ